MHKPLKYTKDISILISSMQAQVNSIVASASVAIGDVFVN